MSVLIRLFVVVEALVCFGPSLLLLVFGLVALPTLANVPFALLMAALGLCGAAGLILAAIQIVSGQRWLLWPTRCLFACGISALLLLSSVWMLGFLSGALPLANAWLVLVFYLLPVACSIHVLWILSPATERALNWSRRRTP